LSTAQRSDTLPHATLNRRASSRPEDRVRDFVVRSQARNEVTGCTARREIRKSRLYDDTPAKVPNLAKRYQRYRQILQPRSAEALSCRQFELRPIRSVEMMGRKKSGLFRSAEKRRRKRRSPNGRTKRFAVAMALAIFSYQPAAADENDPFEANNRLFHNFNISVDQFVYRPVAHAYGAVTPGVVMQGISNMSSNLSVPGIVLNNILQLDVDSALINTARFTINTTLGVGGLLDVAAGLGMQGQTTDFGETFYTYGVSSGPYLVLPLIGPSNTRDAVGTLAGLALNPVNRVLSGDALAGAALVKGLDFLGARYTNSDFLDSLLHDNEESYTEIKLYFEQNRKYRLEGAYSLEFIDPFGVYDE